MILNVAAPAPLRFARLANSLEFTKPKSYVINRHMHIFETVIAIIHIALDNILRIICINDDQSFVVTGRLCYLFKGIVFCFPRLLLRSIYFPHFFTNNLQLASNLNHFVLPLLRLCACHLSLSL